MANQKKTVQFDHFHPYYLAQDENGASREHLYDLRALLEHVMSHPFSETKKKILGDTHMFHKCRRDDQLNVWELQILHLREKILPGIVFIQSNSHREPKRHHGQHVKLHFQFIQPHADYGHGLVPVNKGCILQRDVKITEPFPDGMDFGFIAALNGLQQVFYLTAVQLFFAEVILAESDITP